MRKNKLKLFVCAVAFLLGAFLMTACGNASVTFKTNKIEMGVNMEVDLKDYVTVSGVDFSNVTFISNNPQVALVTQRNTLASGSVTGTAIITAKGYDGFIEVEVTGQGVSFSAPTNVHFDQITNSVVWDTSFVGQTVANVYKFTYTINGGEPQEELLNKNSFEITQAGVYSVKVQCVERDGIGASDYSNEFNFEVLPAPESLQYNLETNLLTWNSEVTSKFYVKKDGVLSELITGEEYYQALAEERAYSISVISAPEANAENVFGLESEPLTLTRLKTPELSVNKGVISWEDTQEGVSQYTVKVFKITNGQPTLQLAKQILHNGTKYSYTFGSLPEGEYEVSVYACGDNIQTNVLDTSCHFMTSAGTTTERLHKLPAPTLAFNKETSTFAVVGFNAGENLSLSILVDANGVQTTTDISSTGQFTYDFSNAGTYKFSVINNATQTLQVNSNPSNEITVVKLGEIDSVTQSVDANGYYKLNDLLQDNATNFIVTKTFNQQTTTLTLNGSNYGLVNEIFPQAGNYVITITSRGNDAQDFYVLEGTTTLSVERLKTVTLNQDEENEKITWDKITDYSNVIFKYDITGEASNSGTTANTYLEYNNLAVGSYTINVYSTGKEQSNVKTLILNAFTPATMQFEIYRQLATPTLSFTKNNNTYNLNINPVANANLYTIYFNGEEFATTAHRTLDTLVIDVTNCINSLGAGENGLEYNFAVYATNTIITHYKQSETASVIVEKLYAPKTFNLNAQEEVSTLIEEEYIHTYSTLINGEQVNVLKPDVKSFNVKIKYIAKTTNFDGKYYIDSDYSEFNLNRTNVELKAKGLIVSWKVASSQNNFTLSLTAKQGEKEYTLPLAGLTEVDLSTIPLETLGFDMQAGIEGVIKCSLASGLSGEIAGSYVNGIFVSGNQGQLSSYDVSANSLPITFSFANSEIGLEVEENGSNVNISWNNASGAVYTLFDGVNERTEILSGNYSISSSTLTEEKTYTMSLTQKIENETKVFIFYVTRLKALTELVVTEDEKLQAPSQVGASGAVLVKDGKDISELSEITGVSESLQAKYSAGEKANDYTFYLDSATVNYTFARLENLNVGNNLKIYNNIISWAKEGTAPVSAYKYVVKFFDNNDSEPIYETLEAKDVNSIDLTSEKYQAILAQLNGSKYVTIIKKVDAFTASVSSTNYLSSGYCQDVLLKIIKAPYGVTLKADENDISQTKLTISWQIDNTGVEIAGYVIKIEHAGMDTQYIETAGSYTVQSDSDLFKNAGDWTISVMALGANDSIASSYSQSITTTRLAPSTNISLNNAGVIVWDKVANANKYRLIYSYTDKEGIPQTNFATYDNSVSSSNLFETAIADQFDGVIGIELYATGDGQNTLSSLKLASFERLVAPQVSFESDRMVIQNFEIYPKTTKFFVIAKIDKNIVLNKEVSVQLDANNKYVYVLPTEYSYVDASGQTVFVDFSSQKNITFEVYATIEHIKYISSNITTSTLTILSPLTNLAVSRDSSNNVHFTATNTNTNIKAVLLTVGTQTYTLNGNIDFVLSDEIIATLGTSWKIQAQAFGSGEYLSSKTEVLTGTKLGNINTITTQYGAVVWNSVVGALDYRFNVDDKFIYTGYTANRNEKLNRVEIVSGDHVIKIKALGNITSQPISRNIVLDGDYSTNYTVTKMTELSDLKVDNGYFTFTEISDVSEYSIVVYSNLNEASIAEYKLVPYPNCPLNNAMTYYYSPELNTKIDELGQVYIKIYNKTLKENHVYSNFALTYCNGEQADYMKVARITNASEQVELYHPTNPDNISLDYATTIATWKQNANSNTGYVLNADNVLTYLKDNTYTLDANNEWASGAHSISYLQLGTTGLSGDRLAYLSADFTPVRKLTKLEPVTIYAERTADALKELSLRYSTVVGANRYLAYVEDVYYREFSNSNINVAITLDDLQSGRVYKNFGMRAVSSSDVTVLASSMSYYSMQDSSTGETQQVKISKLAAPLQPTMKDGAFYWEFSNDSWITMAKGLPEGIYYVATVPFQLSISTIFSQQFVITFTSKTAPVQTYTYMDIVSNYIYMSDSQFTSLKELITKLPGGQAEGIINYLDNVKYNLKGGFSSPNYGFEDFAKTLPSGDYEIKVKLLGDGIVRDVNTGELEARFSSNFLNIGTKYVAPSPSITAVAKAGKYTLEFNNVTVDENYFSSAPTYSLIGVYSKIAEHGINAVEVATVTAKGLNNSELLTFDITKLIQNKVIDGTYIRLYVTVKGNNSNILNGKTSNVINIQILDSLTLTMQRGVVEWDALQHVGKYQVEYTQLSSSISNYVDIEVVDEQEEYSWLGQELAENEKYSITVQACGLVDGRIRNHEKLIMSGPKCSIGTVTKLPNISKVVNGVNIENGIYTWDAVKNASGYDVKYVRASGGEEKVESIFDTYYESQVKDYDIYNYSFMCVGTEYEELSEKTVTYINSDYSAINQGSRLKGIESITLKNGVIEFVPYVYTDYYKLTFYKKGLDNTLGSKVEVFTNALTYDTNENPKLLAFGDYEVGVQVVYKDKISLETNPNAYYLISQKTSLTYFKFEQVYNVKIVDGIISWTYDNLDNIATNNFEFVLTFSTDKDSVTKVVPGHERSFEGVVFNNIETTEVITLNIAVYPSSTTRKNFVKSVETTYNNVHQYQKINEENIQISVTENSQLLVDWSKGLPAESDGFMYQVEWSAGEAVKHFYTTKPLFIAGEDNDISFDITGEYTLQIRIRVIPTIADYISSAWTDKKEITRPKGVSNLIYDQTSQTLTWDLYEGTESWDSYKYKIRDEVTYTNAQGVEVTEVYVITASLSDNKYTPFIIGTHNIEVAVIVSNAAGDGFISEYKGVTNAVFNLFESGAGTEEAPYIIKTAEQFGNMKYRLSKDEKLNEYFIITKEGDAEPVEEKVVAVSTQYFFKQSQAITLEKNGSVDTTLYANEVESYDNVYDGNLNVITFNYTHVHGTTDFAHVSIFKTIGQTAIIKNIKLLFNFAISGGDRVRGNNTTAHINVLSEYNYGTIENVLIGEVGNKVTITTYSLGLDMSFVAWQNHGTISNVVNNYNVSIVEKNTNALEQMQFATISVNNYGVITNVKNSGNIKIDATDLYVGGIVAYNQTGASITGAGNSGNIDIYYLKASTSYVGGIVAKNASATISYTYMIGSITIDANTTSYAYVGGLVGLSEGDNISYSYANFTPNALVANFNIYQIIGLHKGNQSKALYVYYKDVAGFNHVNGTAGTGYKTFTTNPAEDGVELYGTNTMFNKTDRDANGNPRLDFEADFNALEWKEVV